MIINPEEFKKIIKEKNIENFIINSFEFLKKLKNDLLLFSEKKRKREKEKDKENQGLFLLSIQVKNYK